MIRKKFLKLKEISRKYHSKGHINFYVALLKGSLVPLKIISKYLEGKKKVLDMGCGEGIFSNLLAEIFPNIKITGIDLEKKRISYANDCAINNATFKTMEAKDTLNKTDVLIFNDMLHHNSFDHQKTLLEHSFNLLNEEGILFIKEVDKNDFLDKFLTTFFDSKLYPNDKLCYRSRGNWEKIISEKGFLVIESVKLKNFWIASRTFIVAKKIKKPKNLILNNLNIIEKTQKQKVLVTGATGFIGHHMAISLIKNGLNKKPIILFLIVRDASKLDNFLIDNAYILECKFENLNNYIEDTWFHNLDYVFHFAGEVKLRGQKQKLFQSNIEITKIILSKFKNGNLKRFVYASTMGAVDRLPGDDCKEALNENSMPNPLSFYGKTKLDAENLVRTSNIPFSILRIPWSFGTKMTKDTHVLKLLNLVRKGSIITYFDFPGKVSLISVKDLVSAFKLVATNPKAKNNLYFVSGFIPISLGDLFKEIGKVVCNKNYSGRIKIPFLLKKLANLFRRYLPLEVQNLNSDVLCVNSEKLNKLGFKAKSNLNNSLLELARWEKCMKENTGFCIVTGASSGIGKEISLNLYSEGYNLLLIDKNKESLIKLSKLLNSKYICADLSKKSSIDEISSFIKVNSIEGIINCAGIATRKSAIEINENIAEKIFDTNIRAVTSLTRTTLKKIFDQDKGFIINISSSAALQPLAYFADYGASKSFISYFTNTLIYEVRCKRNIKIYDVMPAGTDTNFQKSSGVKKNKNETLLSAEYVAKRIVFLIKNKSKSGRYIIGRRAKVMNLISRALPIKWLVFFWGKLSEEMR